MPWECEIVSDLPGEPAFLKLLRQLIQRAATREPSAPTGEWALTIRLTSDSTISTFHDEFLGDDAPTDVMSFPSGDDLGGVAGYLGDILISLETATANAIAEQHSAEREVAFLALHGLLHLCGHTDASVAEKTAMMQRQTELLEQLETEMGVAL